MTPAVRVGTQLAVGCTSVQLAQGSGCDSTVGLDGVVRRAYGRYDMPAEGHGEWQAEC